MKLLIELEVPALTELDVTNSPILLGFLAIDLQEAIDCEVEASPHCGLVGATVVEATPLVSTAEPVGPQAQS